MRKCFYRKPLKRLFFNKLFIFLLNKIFYFFSKPYLLRTLINVFVFQCGVSFCIHLVCPKKLYLYSEI